jgi:hypothetical protein
MLSDQQSGHACARELSLKPCAFIVVNNDSFLPPQNFIFSQIPGVFQSRYEIMLRGGQSAVIAKEPSKYAGMESTSAATGRDWFLWRVHGANIGKNLSNLPKSPEQSTARALGMRTL